MRMRFCCAISAELETKVGLLLGRVDLEMAGHEIC